MDEVRVAFFATFLTGFADFDATRLPAVFRVDVFFLAADWLEAALLVELLELEEVAFAGLPRVVEALDAVFVLAVAGLVPLPAAVLRVVGFPAAVFRVAAPGLVTVFRVVFGLAGALVTRFLLTGIAPEFGNPWMSRQDEDQGGRGNEACFGKSQVATITPAQQSNGRAKSSLFERSFAFQYDRWQFFFHTITLKSAVIESLIDGCTLGILSGDLLREITLK